MRSGDAPPRMMARRLGKHGLKPQQRSVSQIGAAASGHHGVAIAEAGFSPNTLNAALSTDKMLRQLADFARHVGHFPASSERRMQRTLDNDFPSHGVWTRLGSKAELVARLAEFCANDPSYADVGLICAPGQFSTGVDKEVGTVRR